MRHRLDGIPRNTSLQSSGNFVSSYVDNCFHAVVVNDDEGKPRCSVGANAHHEEGENTPYNSVDRPHSGSRGVARPEYVG